MTLPTHALTLRNPWPWYHFHVPPPHRKMVENRSRNLGFHREFWVHTSKVSTVDDWTSAGVAALVAGVPLELQAPGDGVREKLPPGHIVARVVCSHLYAPGGVNHHNSAPAEDYAASPWYFGQWGYVIESFQLVTPVPCRGSQGFWRVPRDVLSKLDVREFVETFRRRVMTEA